MKKALILVCFLAAVPVVAQSFRVGPNMNAARTGHTATTLQDGRILLCGGSSELRCEIYEPSTNSFRWTASMAHTRTRHSATLLSDGRVLIAGGNASGGDLVEAGIDNKAEIFNPQTETFSPVSPMLNPRFAHAAALMADGRVFISGGGKVESDVFTTIQKPQVNDEIFNPATNSFTAAPPMRTPRWYHTATPLSDGRVLVVGYSGQEGQPSAEMFSAGGSSVQDFNSAARRSNHTATVLRNGKVLLAGGGISFGFDAEVYDPVTNSFQPVETSSSGYDHDAVLLSDGTVLLTRWSVRAQPANTTAVYSPSTNRITAGPIMTMTRYGHRTNLLANGSVLVTGGNANTTEIYDATSPTVTNRKRRAVGR